MAQPQTLLREHVSPLRWIPVVTTAFLALLASQPRAAHADEPPRPEIVIVGDPTWGMEGGARTVASRRTTLMCICSSSQKNGDPLT